MPLPALGFSPETNFYFGAVTLFTFNFIENARTSNAKLEYNYTLNKQHILDAGWNLFLKNEKWFTRGQFTLSKYPDLYFGTGINALYTRKTSFESKRLITETFLLRALHSNWFTGVWFRNLNYKSIYYDKDVWVFPELMAGSVTGLGISLVKDERNNLLNPTKGYLISLNALGNKSKNNYFKFLADLRYYKTWKTRYTLATRLISEINTTGAPFFDMAFLGGDKYVRGYYYGRYRDLNLYSLQTEFRFAMYSIFGISVFGGYSALNSNAFKFGFAQSLFNYGGGLRIMLDKQDKINLRFDYARGEGNNQGFYVAFGESF